MGSLSFTFTVYGMAGLRNNVVAIWQNGAITTLMALIAVQVSSVDGVGSWRGVIRRAGVLLRANNCVLNPPATSKSLPNRQPTTDKQVMHLCALVAPTQDIAFALSIFWTTLQLLFNNFFIRFNEMSLKWLGLVRYVSALYYAYEGLSTVEFRGVSLPCSGGMDPRGARFLQELLPNSKFLKLKVVQSSLARPGPDCVADADAVLDYFGFSAGFRPTVGILLGYWLVAHVLTFLALVVLAKRERR